ncbi:TetR/AcrR family transcriptional regulator [Pseudomonas sp. ABC1]|uniref:TetR/AcrR family transcriptional regulator n=1 Tax=Pseudomonas sp. ABC1 TaxID=2748080 RepID=UPI0015C3557C|nr:TetR/AcrR family transcriptional regulator [Pseudomonas sp. ABC1]QLF93392.1 TetR/AcrR family transcriptional regulator [Pseudomonas sp. ABC1]
MTAIRLQEAALARFAIQGFDATSMSEIASDVGIKKPSIYAHFRNKDELYLSLIPLLINAELEHARRSLQGGEQVLAHLHEHLRGIRQRYEGSHHVAFWVKALLAPPLHIYDVVMEPMHVFMDELEAIIREAIEDSPLAGRLSAATLAIAYMAMIDALHSELVYGGVAKYERRLDALWQVFEAALKG